MDFVWKPVGDMTVIHGEDTATAPLFPAASALVAQCWGGRVFWKRNSGEAGKNDGFLLPQGDYHRMWYNYEEGDYISYWVEDGAHLALQYALKVATTS
jgi:hypothetical protein